MFLEEASGELGTGREGRQHSASVKGRVSLSGGQEGQASQVKGTEQVQAYEGIWHVLGAKSSIKAWKVRQNVQRE